MNFFDSLFVFSPLDAIGWIASVLSKSYKAGLKKEEPYDNLPSMKHTTQNIEMINKNL